MDSSPPKKKKQTRSETSKKNIIKGDAVIPISNNTKSALKKKQRQRKAGAVIYIGHIPHGFYEDEMKSYFNQFGKVLAATVARSKKTGRSRGFGFVEFKDEEVAKIAAETMNNYLMFNRILKCRYIPPDEKRGRVIERKVMSCDFPKQRNRKINEQQKEKAISKLTQETYLKKAQAKIAQFKKFFEERGVEFDFQLNSKRTSSSNISKGIKTKTVSTATSKSEPNDGAEDAFGVLEIDESDNEISFTTPPQVKKVIKKSISSSKTPVKHTKDSVKSETEIQKVTPLPKSRLNKLQKKGKIQKKSMNSNTSGGKKLVQKKEKTLKAREFLTKDISAVTKGKKGNIIRNIDVATTKMQKNVNLLSETRSSTPLRSSKNKIKLSIKAAN